MKKDCVGIDIAKKTFDVAVLKKREWCVETLSNNTKGFEELLTCLSSIEKKRLHICMESTGIYRSGTGLFFSGQRN